MQLSNKERQRRYRARMAEQGLKPLTLYARPEDHSRLRSVADAMAGGFAVSAQPFRLPEILKLLRNERSALEDAGIRHASVFGSVARGEETNESDVDILIETDSTKIRDVLDLIGAREAVAELLPTDMNLDVTDLHSLRPDLRDEVLAQHVVAF